MITRATIGRTLNDGGAHNRVKWWEERRIRAAHADGVSVREIASRWRITPKTVYAILRRTA